MSVLAKARTDRLASVARPPLVGAGLALPPAVVFGIWHGSQSSVAGGLGATVAIVLGGLVAGLAVSLPGKSPEGLLLGIGMPLAAMMAWTRLDEPIYVWIVTAIIGLVALVLTYPWWREWREVPRLGGFWLAVPVWVLGTVSAVALANWTVAAQRVVYGGFALLVVLLIYQTVRRRGRDITVGMVSGILLCHATLMVTGAQYLFATGDRYTSPSAWGYAQSSRFWGGPWLVYHPNFIGMTAAIVALRIGPDAKFRPWQRLGAVAVALFLLFQVESRNSFLIAGVGAVVYGVVHVWRNGLPRFRFWTWVASRGNLRTTAVAFAPALAVCLVFTASGGVGLLFTDRYAAGGGADRTDRDPAGVTLALSGRSVIWGMIGRDFVSDTAVEKIFGNADNSRGYVLRYPGKEALAGHMPGASDEQLAKRLREQPKLTADNGPIGALRRAGVLGVAAFLIGVLLVLWHTARRRDIPIWVPTLVIGTLASGLFEDEIAGTTAAWMVLFAAEAWVFCTVLRARDKPDEPANPEPAPATVS